MIKELLEQLSEKERELFDSILIPKRFEKDTILIKAGSVANKMFFITKGSCRSYFIKDGEDITDFFFFENEFATDFASFSSSKPSKLNLICQEETTALEIHKTDLESLYKQSHSFSEIGRIMAEESFIQIEERMRLLHTESLEIKYNWMLQRFPHVFQRVPQYHIASFLGVKPQSLSRIRAKISGKLY